jgi:hypothetical protein
MPHQKHPTAYRIHVPQGQPVYAKELTRKAERFAREQGLKVEALYTDGWIDPLLSPPDGPCNVLAVYRSTLTDEPLRVGEVAYAPDTGWRPLAKLGWHWAVLRWQPLPAVPDLLKTLDTV